MTTRGRGGDILVVAVCLIVHEIDCLNSIQVNASLQNEKVNG